MKTLRRAIFAVLAAVGFAAATRMRGTGGTPQQTGGWRELKGPEFR
jgi:hypothetical protein